MTRTMIDALESRRLLSGFAPHVPGQLLVRFDAGVSEADVARLYAAHGLAEVDVLGRHLPGIEGRLRLVSAQSDRIDSLVHALGRDPRVLYAEPNRVVGRVGSTVPNDPDLPMDYGLVNSGQSGGTVDADIDADEAWDVHTGSGDVVVAVFDTGIDYTHPDLVDNMWTNPGEVEGNAVDDDGNGIIDDYYGYDTADGDGDPMDDYSHGTHVAGIIGMVGDNRTGSAGVNWDVKLMAVKAADATGFFTEAAVIAGYNYIAMMKGRGVNVRVVNESWGGTGTVEEWQANKEASDAMGAAGILVIAAAHNQTTDNDSVPMYPASFDSPHVISVAASDHHDRITHFSNWGATGVDLAAPGSFVFSSVPGGGYDQWDGTSMATPHVAGAAALVWSAFPSLTAAEVKARLLNGVDPIGHIGPNAARPTVTNGRLNVRNALLTPAPESDDHAAPAPVGNLAVTDAAAPWALALNWTATGDDHAAGRSAFYDVRYSSTPITEANWDVATRAASEPYPAASGAAETFTAEGLIEGTRYYFAMKVKDNSGNESALSNMAAGVTAAARHLVSDDAERNRGLWDATGLWNRSRHRAHDSETSWYYGVEETETYNTGAGTAGALTLRTPLDLSGVDQAVLRFDEFRMPSMAPVPEVALVQASADGENWHTLMALEYPLFGWEHHVVDLSAYAGGAAHLRFYFDSNDADFAPDFIFNDFEGWVIDNVQVLAPDAPPPGFAINDVRVTEGDRGHALATFTVTRPGGGGRASVEYETREGSADQGDDFRAARGTLSFARGETAKTVTVRVRGDEEAEEAAESFTVRLGNARGASIADGDGRATVVDDEPWLWMFTPIVLDEAGDAGVTASFEVPVYLTLPSASPVTIRYRTADGSARAGRDYVPVNRKLTFAPGEMVKYVAFELRGDRRPEPLETYFIDIEPVTPNVSMLRRGVVYVFDDDAPAEAAGTSVAPSSITSLLRHNENA